jgi:cytochrome bd-type quinol oxidase subunit 2
VNPYGLTLLLLAVFAFGLWLGFDSGTVACSDFLARKAFEQRFPPVNLQASFWNSSEVSFVNRSLQ